MVLASLSCNRNWATIELGTRPGLFVANLGEVVVDIVVNAVVAYSGLSEEKNTLGTFIGTGGPGTHEHTVTLFENSVGSTLWIVVEGNARISLVASRSANRWVTTDSEIGCRVGEWWFEPVLLLTENRKTAETFVVVTAGSQTFVRAKMVAVRSYSATPEGRVRASLLCLRIARVD